MNITTDLTAAPRITLANGLRIVNFSSPHPFNFETGEVLEACQDDRALALSMTAHEVVTQKTTSNGILWEEIHLSFQMTPETQEEIERLNADESIDVILAPLPVVQTAKALGIQGKLRTVRAKDRITKTIYADRFCA